MRTLELIAFLLTALHCGSECWSHSETENQNTAGKGSHQLGPQRELEDGKCNGMGGNVLPTEQCTGVDEGKSKESDNTNFGVIERPDDSSVQESVFSFATSTVSSMFSHAKSKIYSGAANVTSDFAEKVREVFHEEMYGFLETLLGKARDVLFSPGELHVCRISLQCLRCVLVLSGTVFYSLGRKALTIFLLLLCVLFSYIFFKFFSLLFILAFNCAMFLTHHFMGPEWIFSQLIWAGGYMVRIFHLMVVHPYITSAVIVITFFASIVIPIVRWTTRRNPEQRIEEIESSLGILLEKIQRIESRQEEMLSILREMNRSRTNSP